MTDKQFGFFQFTVLLIILITGILLFGAASVVTWEYTNSNAFCANSCHSAHPEEPVADQQYSQHANVMCVECHLDRLSFFPTSISKEKEIKHVWSHITSGFSRPTRSATLSVSEKSCKHCHAAQPHRTNRLKIFTHFAEDEKNTETKVGVMLRHVGRSTFPDNSGGIQWHIDAKIRFISTDENHQTIPWVELTHEDGSTTIFRDSTDYLSDNYIVKAKKNTMQCVDCHNQSGHSFLDPEKALDAALANGKLNKNLPFIKKRSKELLMLEFESEDEAYQLVEAAWKQYAFDFPGIEKEFPDAWKEAKWFLKERQSFMANLMQYSRFDNPEISWRSFPENLGHRQSAGCFRCHDGKHVDENSNLIPVNCTTCHSIPLPMGKNGVPKDLLATINMKKPLSHNKSDFMVEHWTKYNKECSSCHKKLSKKKKNNKFCSNSSCHDIRWQELTLRLKPGKSE